MSRVCSQIALVQELTYQNYIIKVPSQILFLEISFCNHFCANNVANFGKSSVRFSKCYVVCKVKLFKKTCFTMFLIEAVSKVPSPDVPKITHGLIYLMNSYSESTNEGFIIIVFLSWPNYLKIDTSWLKVILRKFLHD